MDFRKILVHLNLSILLGGLATELEQTFRPEALVNANVNVNDLVCVFQFNIGCVCVRLMMAVCFSLVMAVLLGFKMPFVYQFDKGRMFNFNNECMMLLNSDFVFQLHKGCLISLTIAVCFR